MTSRMRKLSRIFFRTGFLFFSFLGGSMSVITSAISRTIE